jgi:hypothetical protein
MSTQPNGDPHGHLTRLSPELASKGAEFLNRADIVLPVPWGVRITHGLRTAEQQFELFKKGRIRNAFKQAWVIVNRLRVVTYCDGYKKKSNHQDQDGDGLGDAFDFVLTFHGQAVWYPRPDDEDPGAQTVRELYSLLWDIVRDLGLVTGADWVRFFDGYHVERKR